MLNRIPHNQLSADGLHKRRWPIQGQQDVVAGILEDDEGTVTDNSDMDDAAGTRNIGLQ